MVNRCAKEVNDQAGSIEYSFKAKLKFNALFFVFFPIGRQMIELLNHFDTGIAQYIC